MKLITTALCAFLASSALTAPAAAQSRPAQANAAQASEQKQPNASREALKPLQELQKAIDAKDAAAVRLKLAAAKAAAKTDADRYLLGALHYKFALATNDKVQKAAALQEMLDSKYDGLPPADLYADLGNTFAELGQTDRAIDAFKRSLQLDPSGIPAIGGLAEALAKTNRAAEAVPILKSGIAAQQKGGSKAPEQWYKRAVAIAYNAKLPAAVDLSRDWVAAYPTATNWLDAVRIYQSLTPLDETGQLDSLRLLRATGALKKSADYFTYADLALRKGLSGEAKAVLDEGFAANDIQRDAANFKELYALASTKAKAGKAALPAAPEASANGRQTLNVGDAYLGYGDYAKAAEFYHSALGKSGVDADLVNLHLAMALADAGDAAGAKAALTAVRPGTFRQIADFWQLHLATKS